MRMSQPVSNAEQAYKALPGAPIKPTGIMFSDPSKQHANYPSYHTGSAHSCTASLKSVLQNTCAADSNPILQWVLLLNSCRVLTSKSSCAQVP